MILKLDLFRSDTMWLIEKLGLYLDSMDTAIADARLKDRERIDRLNIKTQDGFDDQQEHLYLHALLFDEDFPSKLRYSFLLMSYIVFESASKALGEELNRRKIVGPKLEKKRKNGESWPQAVRRFLESEPNSIRIIDAAMWTELFAFNDLRNCIVHRGGDVNSWDKSERVMQIIEENKNRGLALNDKGFIQIEVVYCRHVVNVIHGFFDRVFEETGFGPAE